MEYIITKEAAEKWDITECRVQVLWRQGKIDGVFRPGQLPKLRSLFLNKE